jgi:opacity protein-like surface antigen
MKRHLMIATLLTGLCATAQAQTYPETPPPTSPGDPDPDAPGEDTDGSERDTDSDGTDKDDPPNDGDLPQSQSDDDPQPEVPTPGVPPTGLVEQAGVGGLVGYGRVGVVELGGSAGFAAGGGLTQFNVAPSIGWFAADNLELSAIMDLAHVRTDTGTGTMATVLVEPSYHLPFNKTTFAFAGVGIGGAYIKGPGLAFAMAPRIGGNFLIGRSGILTPSISWQYNTHETQEMGNVVLMQVSSAVRANVGYTVMW